MADNGMSRTWTRPAGALPYPAWRTPTSSLGPQLTVLIPAHNEQAAHPAALASLRWQALAPTRVVVVAATAPTARCRSPGVSGPMS